MVAPTPTPRGPRLRSACNSCHQQKIRCSGGSPCHHCASSNSPCRYSVSNRLGRPKGAKNKHRTKAQPLAPATLTSAFPDGRSASMASSILLLSPAADPSDTWQTVRMSINQQKQQQQVVDPSEWSRLETTPPLDTMDYDPLGLEGSDAGILSWVPSPQDLSSIVGGNWMLYGAETQKGCPGSADILGDGQPPTLLPTPPMSTDGSLPPSVYGGASNFGDVVVDPNLDSALSEAAGAGVAGLAAAGGTECSCLQRYTELLCSLKRPSPMPRPTSTPQGSSTRLSIDWVLHNTQEVSEACRAVTDCHYCLDNHDHEVVLLLIMCIRAVLSQIQQLSWQGNDGWPPGLKDSDCGIGGEGRMRGLESSSSSSPMESSRPPAGSNRGGRGVPILIGEFEVRGDDKDVLLRSLRMIALRKHAAGLAMLRQLMDRKKTKAQMNSPDGGCGALVVDYLHDAGGDFRHVERMMDGLMHSVKAMINSWAGDDGGRYSAFAA